MPDPKYRAPRRTATHRSFELLLLGSWLRDWLFLRKNKMPDVDLTIRHPALQFFPIKLDRAPLIAASSLQFRNQRTARLTDFPYCVSFAALISSIWRTPGERIRPPSNIQP
jgi:hypothetical protein